MRSPDRLGSGGASAGSTNESSPTLSDDTGTGSGRTVIRETGGSEGVEIEPSPTVTTIDDAPTAATDAEKTEEEETTGVRPDWRVARRTPATDPFQNYVLAAGLDDQKVNFLTGKLGIDTMDSILATKEATWDRFEDKYATGPLTVRDYERMKGMHLWAVTMSGSDLFWDISQDPVTDYGLLNHSKIDRFLLQQASNRKRDTRLSGETALSNRQRESLESVQSERIANAMEQQNKAMERQSAEMQEARRIAEYKRAAEERITRKKAEQDREEKIRQEMRASYDKPNVSAYPAIPGKKWLNTKKTFLATARLQGLGHVLDTTHEIDMMNPTAMAKYQADCEFMNYVLKVATAKGDVAWIVRQRPEAKPYEIWERIIEWEERTGKESDRAVKASKFLTTERFTSNYPGGFRAYINKFFECRAELDELGQSIEEHILKQYLLNNMSASMAQTTVQNCRVNDYSLDRCVEVLRMILVATETGGRESQNTHGTSTGTDSNNGTSGNTLLGYLDRRDGVPQHIWADATSEHRREFTRRRRQRMLERNGEDTGTSGGRGRGGRRGRGSPGGRGGGRDGGRGRGSENSNAPRLPRELWDQLTPEQQRIYRQGRSQGNGNSNSRSVQFQETGDDDNGQDQDGSKDTAIPPARNRIQSLRSSIRTLQMFRLNQELARDLRLMQSNKTFQACIDRGADTCLFNKREVHVESVTERTAQLNMVGGEGRRDNVKIGTAIVATKIPGERDPVLLVFHESLIGEGKDDVNIIGCNQVRSYGHEVDNCPAKFGGEQAITLQSSKTKIPIQLRWALMTIPFRQPSNKQLQSCERIVMTSDEQWQPKKIQEDGGLNTTDSNDEWPDEGNDTGNDDHTSVPGLDLSTKYGDENEGGWTKVTDGLGPDPTLDNIGYTQRDITQDYHSIAQLEAIVKGPMAGDIINIDTRAIQKNTTTERKYKEKPEDIRHLLGWIPTETVRKTIEATTQLAKNYLRLPMRRHFKSREPALN